jgi:hypothetical protein
MHSTRASGSEGCAASRVRLGYLQAVNPIYLTRKGTLSPRKTTKLVLKNNLMNKIT